MAAHGKYGKPCPRCGGEDPAHTLRVERDQLLPHVPDRRPPAGRPRAFAPAARGLAAHAGGTGKLRRQEARVKRSALAHSVGQQVRCGGRGHTVLSPGGARPPVIGLHADKDVRTRLDGLCDRPLFRVSVSVSRGAAIKRYPRRSPGYYRFEPMIFRRSPPRRGTSCSR